MSMNLSNYLAQSGIKHSEFARKIDVPPAMLYQWLKGIRPVAVKHCSKIESSTDGLVSRRDLRPDDWASIWPDLAPPETPPPPADRAPQ